MAQRRHTHTERTKRQSARNMYVYDNTARDMQVQRQLEEQPKRKLSHEARKNRDKAHHMSMGYVLFLVAALGACAMILINYVQLQAELTTKIQNVASRESELNTLRLENDEAYNRIVSSIDLEEIRRIAIGELGMTYAGEGQIITYSGVGRDYMRKVADDN
ncbi:MAG: cell division protein FtsL [Candidatus Gastranaerophilales bacterium]|nr:cell division protein FtsL [Candidatus Gastranaerophilales bacterium]